MPSKSQLLFNVIFNYLGWYQHHAWCLRKLYCMSSLCNFRSRLKKSLCREEVITSLSRINNHIHIYILPPSINTCNIMAFIHANWYSMPYFIWQMTISVFNYRLVKLIKNILIIHFETNQPIYILYYIICIYKLAFKHKSTLESRGI